MILRRELRWSYKRRQVGRALREWVRQAGGIVGGGGRIRTCEPLRASGFQDHRLQPLGHSSAGVKTAV